MKTTLTPEAMRPIEARLEKANAAIARRYPGESGRRQPVHTVYGGAHLFKSDTAVRLGAIALDALAQYAPDFAVFARALGLEGSSALPETAAGIEQLKARLETDPEAVKREDRAAWFAWTIYSRVIEKLGREAVEDFRIDFEDGYGNRPDAEEDEHATRAAVEVARGLAANTLPPYIGIRIKPLTEELRARSTRTLDIFLTTLLDETRRRLPANFVITLPKVTTPEQVSAFSEICDLVEAGAGLSVGALKMEVMIETTQSIINERGESNLPLLLDAARGRLTGAHFGTYDYTASCSITAAHQHMLHPACDFARQMMQVAFAGTGIWLSDGATNIMPVGPHRAAEARALSEEQREENRAAVHRAWRMHFEHTRHSLANAFYQGWDLHPAQLGVRYAAVYSFFLESLDQAAARLRNFVERAAQATLLGDVFDDAATGQGLLNYFLRAINCGAISESEATALTGLSADELRSASFVRILKGRTS